MIVIVFFHLNEEVGVKRLITDWMLVSGLLVAGGAYAVPVTWTIPATTLSGSGNSVSGTFDWDSTTSQASNVSITVTLSGTSTLLTSWSPVNGGYVYFNPTNPTSGSPSVSLPASALTGQTVTTAV
jgi:hypothetical protein